MRWLMATLLVGAVGCGGGATFRAGVYAAGTLRYRVGTLPASWSRVDVPGGQVAFVEQSTSATIHVNGACDQGDASLRVLTGHLLFGFTDRRILSQRRLPFASREALRTVVSGKIDGVARQMDLLVLKKDGCVYDLTYSASPASFDLHRPDFDRFVAGFRRLDRQGSR